MKQIELDNDLNNKLKLFWATNRQYKSIKKKERRREEKVYPHFNNHNKK